VESVLKGWRIETCKGPRQGCANRAAPDDALAADIDGVFAGRDFGAGLRALVGAKLKARHELTVAIADCPNACSRPQIADLGLIGAAEPQQTGEVCHQCMGCVHACREGAIAHPGLLPILDPAKCVRCGACCRVCLSGTLQVGRRGWRILLGGRLGRHPRLGSELPGIFAREGVLAAASDVVDFYLRNARGGERFADLLERVGEGGLTAGILERAARAPLLPPRKPAPILRGPV
jgi:dissimilatory sulfite reductase (desulfoviridin) alpha/beta subunit